MVNIEQYAIALFKIAKQENKVLDYKQEMILLNQCLLNVEDFNTFISKAKISKDVKKELIINSFKDKLSTNILNLLCILIERNGLFLYKELIKYFIKLANKDLNIKMGLCYSPIILSQEELKKIEDSFSYKVELEFVHDESLISGLKIVFDDEVIDTSIQTKMKNLYQNLKQRSNYEI